MVGDNKWSCIANNLIQGNIYQTAKSLHFEAGKSYIFMCNDCVYVLFPFEDSWKSSQLMFLWFAAL